MVKREETAMSLTEYFENRDDFLCYRHAIFGKRVKKFGPQAVNHRPIIVSTYDNDDDDNNDDDDDYGDDDDC